MIGWAVETLVASSLLMLVVLAVRGPVARHFGPQVAYGLWLLPGLRMLLPPLPEQIMPAPLKALPTKMSMAEIEALLAVPMPAGAASAEQAVNWPLLIGTFWCAGAALFFTWHICSYRRFVRAAMGDAMQLPRLDRDGVEVCASSAASGPFAAGIFLKTVVLPEDYRRRYQRDELRLAIEHELQHHRRCDMSANFAALIVLALHWWNPIAYFAHRAFRADQELACDALVLARATPAERHAYGTALLKSACDRLPVAACALGAGDDLKRRLTMMKVYRWNAARARAGSAVAALLVGGGLLLTASNGFAAETTKKVEDKVRTALAPVVPAIAPPDAPDAPPLPDTPPPPPAVPAHATHIAYGDDVAPVPPIPPVPPVAPAYAPRAVPAIPPVPRYHGYVDGDAISRQVNAEVRASQAEAMAAAREARAAAMQAAREAMRARPIVKTGACAENVPVMVREDGDRQVMVRCTNFQPIDQAELRRTIVASLIQARRTVAESLSEDLGRHARDEALAGLDREIARLKSEQ